MLVLEFSKMCIVECVVIYPTDYTTVFWMKWLHYLLSKFGGWNWTLMVTYSLHYLNVEYSI